MSVFTVYLFSAVYKRIYKLWLILVLDLCRTEPYEDNGHHDSGMAESSRICLESNLESLPPATQLRNVIMGTLPKFLNYPFAIL